MTWVFCTAVSIPLWTMIWAGDVAVSHGLNQLMDMKRAERGMMRSMVTGTDCGKKLPFLRKVFMQKLCLVPDVQRLQELQEPLMLLPTWGYHCYKCMKDEQRCGVTSSGENPRVEADERVSECRVHWRHWDPVQTSKQWIGQITAWWVTVLKIGFVQIWCLFQLFYQRGHFQSSHYSHDRYGDFVNERELHGGCMDGKEDTRSAET